MELALAWHLDLVALGGCVQQQNFLSAHNKTALQVIDGGAFAHATLFVRYTFAIWGFPLVHRFSRLRRDRWLCNRHKNAGCYTSVFVRYDS